MKNLFIALAALVAVGCSKNEEQKNTNKEVVAVIQVLNGKFIGSLYSSVTNTTETEEIVFTQYSSPKDVLSLEGRIKAHGVAVLVKYFNDHLLEISKNCYYSVSVNYTGAQSTISFYPYRENGNVTDTEDKRIITVLSNKSFKMRGYGLTEDNDKTFIKQ